MAKPVPGLKGAEHIGITVPNIEEATKFFVDVLGCVPLFDVGPYRADDNDWMKDHLNVDPRAVITKLRMLKCAGGPSLELFEYTAPTQAKSGPRNSDIGGHHIAFYVDDMAAAVRSLKEHGVRVLGDPTKMADGPSAGLEWVYFLAPWGLQLELVCFPQGMAFQKTTQERVWKPAG